MTRTYTTTSGETIEYPEPEPDVADYLARIREATQDPTVSKNELIDMIYDAANPLLKTNEEMGDGGRSMVTEETFHHPVYKIMKDQLALKRQQQGDAYEADFNPYKGYDVTVPEASEELGMSESAVRQAIYSGKIDAVKRGGSWRIAPSSVERYEVSNAGPDRDETGEPLEVVVGNRKGASFSIAHDGDFEPFERDENVYHAEVTDWTQAAIKQIEKHEGGDAITYLELEPDDETSEVRMAEFGVEGSFRICKSVTGYEEAGELFRAFNESLPDD